MNVTEIISQVLARDDNISETAADNTTRRTRLLEYLREVVAEAWWRVDWTWKKTRDTVIVPAGVGYVALPPDFQSFGVYGGVYLPSGAQGDGAKLEMVAESVIMDLRESGFNTGQPKVFAIFGQDSVSFVQLIQIPTNGGAVTLVVWYQPNQPYIDEVGDATGLTDIAMTAASSNTGILTSTITDFTTVFGDSKRINISGFTESANNGDFDITAAVTANAINLRGLSSTALVNEPLGDTIALSGYLYNIRKIPEKYHQLVLVPGLRQKARESKGDARWQYALAEYQNGLKFMQGEEVRFQGEYRQVPSFFGRPSN